MRIHDCIPVFQLVSKTPRVCGGDYSTHSSVTLTTGPANYSVA